jgi:hypothetical protein
MYSSTYSYSKPQNSKYYLQSKQRLVAPRHFALHLLAWWLTATRRSAPRPPRSAPRLADPWQRAAARRAACFAPVPASRTHAPLPALPSSSASLGSSLGSRQPSDAGTSPAAPLFLLRSRGEESNCSIRSWCRELDRRAFSSHLASRTLIYFIF